MDMRNLKPAALALLTLITLASSAYAGSLDNYYLQQFGEAPGTAHTALKALSAPAEPLEARCGMPLKHDLRRDWDKLESATQKVLAKQLAAPVLSGPEATPVQSPSGRFRIHYTTTAPDAPPLADANVNGIPDWVETVAQAFDDVAANYVILGWSLAPTAAGAPYDVYLRELSALKLYGQTTSTQPLASPGFVNAVGSFIEIDNNYLEPVYQNALSGPFTAAQKALQSLQITATHEYHHAIQFGYNVFFDVWYAEATSTWYEGELYPLIRQLYGYVPGWFTNSTRRLDLAVDTTALTTGAGYGRWIFNRYLAEQHASGVVRSFWENLAPLPSPNGSSDIPMLPVMDTTLGGNVLSTDFLNFARRVYRQADWPLAYDKTSAHLLYKPVSTYIGYPVNSLSTPKPEAFLEQYSFAYCRFSSAALPGDTIYVNGKPAIVARAFRKDTLGNITEFNFPTSYPSSVTIPNANTATEIVLLLVNTSGNTTQNANFSTDGNLLTTAPVTSTTPPAAAASSGGGGGGCFIATAAYGSYLHPQVQILRDFRDTRLMTSAPGRTFVALYYRLSPPIADFIARHDFLRLPVRLLLTPLVLCIAHPATAGALLLSALFSTAGLVRWRKTTYDVHQDSAV